jgi:hypothetical protein
MEEVIQETLERSILAYTRLHGMQLDMLCDCCAFVYLSVSTRIHCSHRFDTCAFSALGISVLYNPILRFPGAHQSSKRSVKSGCHRSVSMHQCVDDMDVLAQRLHLGFGNRTSSAFHLVDRHFYRIDRCKQEYRRVCGYTLF